MKLQLGPEIISSYKRLAYQAWYALAEFVDNSTQAYFNNRKDLDRVYKQTGGVLTVEITCAKDFIRISDNSMGMSKSELESAIHIGHPPENTKGRSRYGLGLKTGASWFGDIWTIHTKKLGETYSYLIEVNVPEVAKNNLDLPTERKPALATEHSTVIEIRKLHRTVLGPATARVRNYLRSLYRKDIEAGRLVLKLNGKALEWNEGYEERIAKYATGLPAKQEFHFKIGGKKVSGWAGVLEKGSRKDAGFSIIQADRVIMGWPKTYKPATIFGEQEGGTNDLVNQRLFGELVLEDFEVSHTKDQILFEDGEQDELENELSKTLKALRSFASSYRKGSDERVKRATDAQKATAVAKLEAEVALPEMGDYLKGFEIPNNSLLRKSNEIIKENVVKARTADLETKIGSTSVSLYLAKDMSRNDPYIIIEATKKKDMAIVIINLEHPHWAELTHAESILNFIRHCTYDGVAESKAFTKMGKIEPDTVKLIKDNLLRIPMTTSGLARAADTVKKK